MVTWEDLKKAELGQTLDANDLKICCKDIYGGVSFPDKKPGFAVVVAMNRFRRCGTDGHDVCLLDEYESLSMRDLVWQCGVLDFKYEPKRWIGDRKNEAAASFIGEMNRDRESQGRGRFSLVGTPMLEMKSLYPYVLDEIKKLRNPKHRQLFMPDESQILSYLGEIEGSDITDLQLGDFPAIEALAFAVIEMRKPHLDDIPPSRVALGTTDLLAV